VIARGEVMDALGANSISTFGGNPLVTRAALANLAYHHKHDLPANARRVGGLLKAGLLRLAEQFSLIGEVRGKGLMLALELVGADGRAPNAAAAGELLERAKQAGLLLGKGGFYGNVIRISPPMSLTEAESEEGLGILRECLTAL
jgi:4-aminobutyrate aminotransferase